MVAHFQWFKSDKVPIAVGVRFLCIKIIQKMLALESSKNDFKQLSIIDVLVASIGDMTKEKMILLNELWKYKIRAEANLSSDISQSDLVKYCSYNNIKFLITFKKTVYSQNNKVKVRDFERGIETDEPRESVAKFIKNRIFAIKYDKDKGNFEK